MKRLLRKCMAWVFKASGWRVVGTIPPDIPKAILVGGGHTSNWDLYATLGALTTLDKKFHFLIKKEALGFPFKRLMLAIGAIPVTRNVVGGKNMVQQVVEFISHQESGYICIAPEGTRKATAKWKSGFYHIAKSAQLPMILCYLDYEKKLAVVGKVIQADRGEAETMATVKDYFQLAVPKYPEKFIASD